MLLKSLSPWLGAPCSLDRSTSATQVFIVRTRLLTQPEQRDDSDAHGQQEAAQNLEDDCLRLSTAAHGLLCLECSLAGCAVRRQSARPTRHRVRRGPLADDRNRMVLSIHQ
jgi:hypothetical protein